jgi:hypothetical protein
LVEGGVFYLREELMRGNIYKKIVFTVTLYILVAFILSACEQNSREDDFGKKVQCVEVGKIYFEKTIRGLGGDSSIYNIKYETSYNKKMNTCLFFGETTYSQGKREEDAYIRDILHNKTLYMMVYGPDDTILPTASSFKTEQEFTDKYKELFMSE